MLPLPVPACPPKISLLARSGPSSRSHFRSQSLPGHHLVHPHWWEERYHRGHASSPTFREDAALIALGGQPGTGIYDNWVGYPMHEQLLSLLLVFPHQGLCNRGALGLPPCLTWVWQRSWSSVGPPFYFSVRILALVLTRTLSRKLRRILSRRGDRVLLAAVPRQKDEHALYSPAQLTLIM